MVSLNVARVRDLYEKVLQEIAKVVVGNKETKETLMLALVAGGHILVEGPPGSAKTFLARSFARAVGVSFKRIQCTPDMMPADITGFNLYSNEGKSGFIEGPIFANIVLADELNRTTPRTQSALLEAMQERQVTIERQTYPLAQPFMVIATQVLAGGEGTYSLTDVQVDRFFLRVQSRYLSKNDEKEVILNIDQIDASDIRTVTSLEEVREAQSLAREVHLSPDIADYIVSIMNSLRADPDLIAGPSTRGSIALYKCTRVLALLDGRDFVIPDDIKHLAPAVIEHRLKIKPEAAMDDITPATVLQRTLDKVPVPKFK